jgi:hypothetical protein
MAIKSKLTGTGIAPVTATQIAGTVTNTLTATGSTQGTALAITDDINICTTVAASTGVLLRNDLSAGDVQIVANYGANTLSVYPPGTGKINNGSASAAHSVAANKVAYYTCIDGGSNASFLANLTA